jgi:hypothetical protein
MVDKLFDWRPIGKLSTVVYVSAGVSCVPPLLGLSGMSGVALPAHDRQACKRRTAEFAHMGGFLGFIMEGRSAAIQTRRLFSDERHNDVKSSLTAHGQ